MSLFDAIILAIVEGITEFLPISSTGHMIIAGQALGVPSDEFVKAFTVIIQFGAILSVIVLYWKRFFRVNKIDKQQFEGQKVLCRLWNMLVFKYNFYLKLLVAFLPAAIFGLLFSDKIDELLESVSVVAISLILGGIFMLFVDKIFAKTTENQETSWRKALFIGFCQCIAMIPGVSRSMATIVGGMSQKLTRKNAAEFSFFLAVPTMFAASAYKLYKLLSEPASYQLLIDNMSALIVGNIVAFAVAILAIKFFINFLTKYGFKAFGYYRIVVGATLLILLLCGIKLQIN